MEEEEAPLAASATATTATTATAAAAEAAASDDEEEWVEVMDDRALARSLDGVNRSCRRKPWHRRACIVRHGWFGILALRVGEFDSDGDGVLAVLLHEDLDSEDVLRNEYKSARERWNRGGPVFHDASTISDASFVDLAPPGTEVYHTYYVKKARAHIIVRSTVAFYETEGTDCVVWLDSSMRTVVPALRGSVCFKLRILLGGGGVVVMRDPERVEWLIDPVEETAAPAAAAAAAAAAEEAPPQPPKKLNKKAKATHHAAGPQQQQQQEAKRKKAAARGRAKETAQVQQLFDAADLGKEIMPSEVKPGHAEALVPHLYEFVARHPPLSGMARGRAAGDPSSYCPFRTLKWYTSFRDYIMTIDGFDAYLGGNQSRARTKKLMVELAIRQERAHRNTITLFFLMEYHQDVKGYLISTFAKFGNLGLTSLASKIFEVGEDAVTNRMLEIAFDYPIHLCCTGWPSGACNQAAARFLVNRQLASLQQNKMFAMETVYSDWLRKRVGGKKWTLKFQAAEEFSEPDRGDPGVLAELVAWHGSFYDGPPWKRSSVNNAFQVIRWLEGTKIVDRNGNDHGSLIQPFLDCIDTLAYTEEEAILLVTRKHILRNNALDAAFDMKPGKRRAAAIVKAYAGGLTNREEWIKAWFRNQRGNSVFANFVATFFNALVVRNEKPECPQAIPEPSPDDPPFYKKRRTRKRKRKR